MRSFWAGSKKVRKRWVLLYCTTMRDEKRKKPNVASVCRVDFASPSTTGSKVPAQAALSI